MHPDMDVIATFPLIQKTGRVDVSAVKLEGGLIQYRLEQDGQTIWFSFEDIRALGEVLCAVANVYNTKRLSE